MEKNIKKLLLLLWVELGAVVTSVLVLIVLGQLGVFADCMIEPKSNEEFVMNTVSIGITIVGIPLAMKLFHLNTTHGLRRMNLDEALQAYHVWSVVRGCILEISAVVGVVAYYLTNNTTGILCALATMVVLCMCVPSRKKIDVYLESLSQQG